MLAVAACYGVVGWISLTLAIPTRYATPIFPAAGVALAGVLAWGSRAAWGVALGSLVNERAAGRLRARRWPVRIAVPLALAAGACVQALVGARLVRRSASQPLVLNEPRDIAAFFGLGAFVACFVSPSVGTAPLGIAGFVAPSTSASTGSPGGSAIRWAW
jgi:integral membrane sensor domain MASE1